MTSTTPITTKLTLSPALILCELGVSEIESIESYSPFCVKVHRALKAAGLTYERRHENNPGSYKHLNPSAQVPVLLVDGVPLADSTRIVARISELGVRRLIPADPRERADALLWEELADTSLNGFLVASRWADPDNWPLVCEAYFAAMPSLLRAIIPGRIRAGVLKALHSRDVWRAGEKACWERYQLLLDQLEARAPLDGYWVGSTLSVADLALFAQLHPLRNGLTAKQREWIGARPVLTAYLDRIDRETATTFVPATAGRGKHASWAAASLGTVSLVS